MASGSNRDMGEVTVNPDTINKIVLYAGKPRQFIDTKAFSKGHKAAKTNEGLNAAWKNAQKKPRKA